MTEPRLVFGRDDPPPESSERMAWVARGRCGHIVSAHADDGSLLAGEASRRWVGGDGEVYERTTAEAVREEGFCSCGPVVDQEGMGL